MAVCGSYKKYGPRLPNLGTHYEDFSDLGKILEKARLHYSPNFAAGETNDTFLQPLAVESEQNARRLLYVAMTRAKEMLILERCGFIEEKEKNNYWNLLFSATSPRIENGKVTIGKKSFPCKQVTIEKGEPKAFEQPAKLSKPALLSVIGRRAIVPVKRKIPLTPDTLNPSSMPKTKAPDDLVIKTIQYGDPLDIKIDRSPTEVGTILHRCFEILTADEDRTHLLDAGTGYRFSGQEKRKLQKSVTDFERWLSMELGASQLQKELPITYKKESGSIVNGCIDLLINAKEGYWIIDHKTHTPHNSDISVLKYWDQLGVYGESISQWNRDSPKVFYAINWVTESKISMLQTTTT